ncbi:MAG: NUDIX domain-containing protein [Limisphaerales bacterium]
MIRNVIFDWSGTLVDDLPAVWEATNYVLRQAGIPEITLDVFRAEFCLPFKKFYLRYTPHVPKAQLEAWFHSRFEQVQHSVVELPYARDFLTFCRQRGLRTFLLSTMRRDHFSTQAARNGFDRFLDETYLEVMDKRAKILEVMERHGLAARETVFVGDMQHDIETARHGGIFSCAVLTGYNGLEQLRAAEPDLIVEHLGELREILETNGLDLARAASGQPPAASGQPVVTVGALIFNAADQVLMIRTHKWSDLWGIPGGKIKFGESSTGALLREILEETGLTVTGVEFVLVQDCIHSPEFYRDAHFVLLNYTCRCAGEPAVKLNDEAREFRWVSLADARKLPLNQPTLRLIGAVEKRGSNLSGEPALTQPPATLSHPMGEGRGEGASEFMVARQAKKRRVVSHGPDHH